MVKDVKELVDAVLKKTDKIFIPEGKTTWRLPVGIPSLDRVLGGGLPGGAIVQIYGPESAGKTTLAYQITGQAVKLGYPTLYIGLEGYSEQYAQACGVDTNSEYFHKISGDFAEEVFNLCIEGLRNYDLKVVVMDSITAAIPKSNIDKKQPTDNIDKGPSVAAKARTIGYFVEQLQHPIRRKQALFVTVNQLRSNIGKFTSGLKPSGGLALQYYTDVKISMWGSEDRTTGDIDTKVTVSKGKEWDVVPWGTTTLHMAHGKGIDIDCDVISICEKAGIVKKAGSWYSYNNGTDEVKYQGLTAFSEGLKNNSALRDELYEKATQSQIEVEVVEPEEDENEDES